MLINTVILALRDLLPIFIAIVLLRGYFSKGLTNTILLLSLLAGAAMTLLLGQLSPALSELYQGAGLELTLVAGYCLVYGGVLFALCTSRLNQLKQHYGSILAAALALLIALKSVNFIVYFTGYWQGVSHAKPLFIGLMLGLGISLSFAILLYVLAQALKNYRSNLLLLLLLTFFSAQLSQVLPLLAQIDWLAMSTPLWDSSVWLHDSSEYGYLLHTLLGYQAKPAWQHLALVAMASLIPFVFLVWQQKKMVLLEANHD